MQAHDRPQGAPVLALTGDSVSVKRMQYHAPYAWLLYVKMAGFSGDF
ncbi:acetyl xylan esterase [Enterobacter sp. CGMCC 5087]|nr:acetyl xylan esterase [Enterobacter sp. CGMCC 5087]